MSLHVHATPFQSGILAFGQTEIAKQSQPSTAPAQGSLVAKISRCTESTTRVASGPSQSPKATALEWGSSRCVFCFLADVITNVINTETLLSCAVYKQINTPLSLSPDYSAAYPLPLSTAWL